VGVDPSKNRALDVRSQWRHLANTIERLCSVAESATRVETRPVLKLL